MLNHVWQGFCESLKGYDGGGEGVTMGHSDVDTHDVCLRTEDANTEIPCK